MAEQTVKQKLNDVLLSVSWADLSRNYFGKSNAWLYHKIDGVDKSGNQIAFTDEECEQLRGALLDLSIRIRRAAELL